MKFQIRKWNFSGNHAYKVESLVNVIDPVKVLHPFLPETFSIIVPILTPDVRTSFARKSRKHMKNKLVK